MPALHGGASLMRAISIPWVYLAVVASSRVMTAQSVHPFAAPTTMATFSWSSAAGLVDVNRDGSPDVIVPGLFFGTMVTALDENGNALSVNGPGPSISPVLGGTVVPRAIAMAGGKIDQDEREDLVTVTACGSVRFHKNLGSTLLDRGHFVPDLVIDNFSSSFPISPPFVNYSFPVAQILDFDLDGSQDVLIAGGPIDRWGAATCPGFVGFYKGDGVGGFQTIRHNLPGNVIDMEFADLDNNGTRDCLVVLTETGSVGAFGYDLIHLQLVGGTLVAMGAPQNIGSGRLTALELADVMGDANNDYILAQTLPTGGGSTSSRVYYYQGDGQGHANSSLWGTFLLPANQTPLGDFIASIQVADFNRDTHPDIAILRGFVQAPPAASGGSAINGDCEILVAMGPNLIWALVETIPLPGYHCFSSTYSHNFSFLPLVAEPEFLRLIDLGGDSSMDFLVNGVQSSTAAMPMMSVTLRNLTPPMLGDARFEKVGDPSGGVLLRPARIGFDGGRPRPGNGNFACTLLNVQGGSLVGLMWGSVGIANLFSIYGLQLNLAPTEFGFAAIAAGSLPGHGFCSYALPIPNQLALVGDAGYFQYNYYDPVIGAFGGTQATGLWIGN